MVISTNKSVLRFGIITDIHYALESNIAAAPDEDLRACLDCFKNHQLDFLLQLGDLIQGGDTSKEEELRHVCALLDEFQAPVRHVLGNHCLALPREELLAALRLHNPFYSFSLHGYRFIVLDGMDVSVLRTPETDEELRILAFFRAHPELHDYCGAVGTKQKVWLKHELERAEQAGEIIIALCHFPLLPETTDQKHGLLWNHNEIVDLLASSPALKVCLGGHFHHGGYKYYRGKHFVVFPAFVNRLEHPDFTCGTAKVSPERMIIRNQADMVIYDLPFL